MKIITSILVILTCYFSFGQDTHKMPPLEMLSGEDKVKHILEMEYPSSYSIFNLEGDFIDSGYGEFIDYTHYEPGIYFLNYDTIKTTFEREVETIDVLNIQEENEQLSWMLIGVLCLTALLIIIFIIRLITIKKNQNLLLIEIENLKKNARLTDASVVTNTSEVELRRDQIEEHISSKLNESDWNIIHQLIRQPSISNRHLADLVALSVEGCRSSLKKMYRLFEIPSSRNMKLTLVIKLIQLSKADQ